MTLKAIVHSSEEGGYWAGVSALPGCLTQTETPEDLKVIRNALSYRFMETSL